MRELCDPKSEMKLKTSLQMFFSSDWVATFKRQIHLLSLDVDSLQKVKLTPNPSARPFFYHGQYTVPTVSLNTHFQCNTHFAIILLNIQFYLQK